MQAERAVPDLLCQAERGFRRADRGQRAGWEQPEPETEEWKALPELQALQERSVQPGEERSKAQVSAWLLTELALEWLPKVPGSWGWG